MLKESNEILERNVQTMFSMCEDGLAGKVSLLPRELSMPLTNRCNCYCIMCHACSEEYTNRTYHNAEPFEITLKQFKLLFPMPKKSILDRLLKKQKVYEEPIAFMFGSAETLINRDIYEIVSYIKSIYPNSKIRLISNGTIPPHPKEIVKYIDRIGFSVDGCTESTFEYLRTPAKFAHVMKTIRQWDEAASQFNDSFSLGFGTVLSSFNIAEFPSLIKLASTFKHIDSVYVQPIILHESLAKLKDLLLNNVESTDLQKYIDDAKTVSQDTGVRIDNVDAIDSSLERRSEENVHTVEDFHNSKYCRYIWNRIVSLKETGELRYLCCYMDQKNTEELMSTYNIPVHGSAKSMYNSIELWTLRKDMLSGKLISYCKGCNLCDSGHKSLSEERFDLEQSFYV